MVRSIAKDMQDNSVSASEAKSKLLKRWEENLSENLERVENAKKRGNDKNLEDVQFLVDRSKKLIDTIKDIDENDFNKRHLYEVEIPDPVKRDTPTGSNYREENRKLTNDEFEKIISELYKQDEKAARIALGIYGTKEAFLADGRHIYNLLADAMSPKEASKFLESLGYD